MSAAVKRRRRGAGAAAGAAARRAGTGARRASAAAAALPPPWRARLLGATAVAALLALGWFGWFRDSSFAQVEDVRVTGLHGPQAGAIRAALTDAGRNMTTLHVREDELREAIEAYPTVTHIEADGDFPHELTIAVRQEPPIGALELAGERVPVSPDGSLLRGVRYDHHLPLIGAPAPPGVDRIEAGQAHRLVTVLAAAPEPMLARIRDARIRKERGIVLRLRRGPDLIFGDTTRLRAKWIAATRVLASRSAQGAAYIDLRLPERPAAGGLAAQTVEPTDTPGLDPAVPAPEPAEPAPAAPAGADPAATPQAQPAPTQTTPAQTPPAGQTTPVSPPTGTTP